MVCETSDQLDKHNHDFQVTNSSRDPGAVCDSMPFTGYLQGIRHPCRLTGAAGVTDWPDEEVKTSEGACDGPQKNGVASE